MASSKLRIGIFGGGTVGGGVYELLKASSKVSVEQICVRSLTKSRDFSAPSSLFTTNPNDILHNEAIDVVVELMGGTGLAKTVVLEALAKGKSVVTANKVLMAEHLEELREAALKAQRPLLYEATVCGGIPIINLLQTAYTGDTITSIQGIANGTTNFMLTQMEEGADYDKVLKEAQELGYAEADPTADVEGHDVQAKLALLAKLAYGTTVPPEQMVCVGISRITSFDIAAAQSLDSTIKLLGTTTCHNPQRVSIYVLPVLVSRRHVLATIRGSGNAICVTSHNLGPCLYTGPGAGRFPTANSVVADIYRIAHGVAVQDPFARQSSLKITSEFQSVFYVRVTGADAAAVQAACQDQGVVLDRPANVAGDVSSSSLAWITQECSYTSVQAVQTALGGNDKALVMPVLEGE